MAAAESDSATAQTSLEWLCRRYWYPIYAFVRQRGHDVHAAEDLTQGFFLAIIEGWMLKRVDRQKGRFRTFMLTALTNFLHNERDRTLTAKRGGGRPVISLEDEGAEIAYLLEAPSGEPPETLFERRWAAVLVRRVLALQREEFARRNRQQFAATLEPFLTGEPTAADYDQVARKFGMEPGAVKVALHRARRRFGELLRNEVAHTVACPDDVETELRHLIAIIARPDIGTSA